MSVLTDTRKISEISADIFEILNTDKSLPSDVGRTLLGLLPLPAARHSRLID